MTKLTPSQIAALTELSKHACTYEEIAGASMGVSVNGRTLAGLVRRGLAIRGNPEPEGCPWEITDAGRKALQEQYSEKG